jgi:hypothetical protein
MKAPGLPSQLITPSWPLQQWGIDIVSKLNPAQGNYTFAIVAVEYFTKWIEAKPITNISSTTIKKFFWQSIICCYGVPQHITVDNAKQFNNDMFKDFYHQVGIKVAFTSVYHHQSNGAIERANALIFEAIKKILEGETKGKWDEVMPRVVWSHNMIVSRATNFTRFWLLFREEVVLPKGIKHHSLWTAMEVPPHPSEAKDKDLLEPDRLKVVVNLQKYQDQAKGMEAPEGQTKRVQRRWSSSLVEPTLWELQKIRTKMGWAECGREKVEAGGIPPFKFLGQDVGAFLEHGQPSLFLHLK